MIDMWVRRENFGLCWVDIGTGTVHVGVASSSSLADELARISPVEVLVPNVYVVLLPNKR